MIFVTSGRMHQVGNIVLEGNQKLSSFKAIANLNCAPRLKKVHLLPTFNLMT